MPLTLTVENMDRLPDGGPLRVQVEARGLEIGRHPHLDWTLPDPVVSGKHCEVRYRDGGYWLHDVSTNGTFVNGAQFRPDAPHRLRNGDRLSIGPYIVAVEVSGEEKVSAPAPGFAALADLWSDAGSAAPPEDRRAYMPQAGRKPPPDFLEFASGVAAPSFSPGQLAPSPFDSPAAPPNVSANDDWLRVPATPVFVAPPEPAIPEPRRMRQRPATDASASQPALADAPPLVEAPAPPSVPREPPPPVAGAGDSALLARIAAAAGIPARAIAGRDPDAVANEIGSVLRLLAQNLAQMLASRSETKGLMRSSSRTMIRALENNPLKFTAAPEEALAIMFGPPTRNYLDAPTTIERSFADLKAHQLQTFGAMQGALEALFDDLAPPRIDATVEPDRGLGALVGSRKAKLWDVYVERWKAKSKRSDGRLNEAFMALFAESYDKLRGPD